jgi:pilus assembly protein Flp/PilA
MKFMKFTTDAADRALRFAHDERGATAIEYSVVAAGVAMAVAGAIRVLGNNVLTNLYDQLAAAFS